MELVIKSVADRESIAEKIHAIEAYISMHSIEKRIQKKIIYLDQIYILSYTSRS
jgi:hypothetical protein